MKTGLGLEGGAMRGMFTCGVLDVLMEHGIDFDGAAGVSAGAVFGCNFKSHQIGRPIRYNNKYCNDPRYCSLRSLITPGDLYGAGKDHVDGQLQEQCIYNAGENGADRRRVGTSLGQSNLCLGRGLQQRDGEAHLHARRMRSPGGRDGKDQVDYHTGDIHRKGRDDVYRDVHEPSV